MSRRREPDRSQLPPAESVNVELSQAKAFADRLATEPPARDYDMIENGEARADLTPGDKTPANDTDG